MSNMKKATFEDLLARRDQREADKLKVGAFRLPGSDTYLEAVMPSQSRVLSLYGEMAGATTTQAALEVEKHAIYDCCPQLQDKELQVQLGVEKHPMSILDALFSIAEQDSLGEQALLFMGLILKKSAKAADEDAEEDADEAPGLEQVKN